MINCMSIHNFKSLRDVQTDLERFTVFVGPNASGKSSILQAMDALCRTFRVDHPEQLDGEFLQSASRGSPQIEFAAESGAKAYRYRTRTRSASPAPKPTWNGDGRGIATTLAKADWSAWKKPDAKSTPLPLSVLLRLETSKLVQPNPVANDPTVMAPDGTGLHSALASMALNDPDSWQALQANLRRIIPTIRRLRHTKAASVHQPAALLFDTVGADSLPANQVSEGTLLVLGLLAALHAPGRPNLVLLDDLDRGLHPKAQRELISLLRGLLDTNPDLQLLATTHSPYMLDSMETNEVRMTFLRDDGSTVCAALTSHPKFPKWKDEMTPGEMWSLFGEKWLVEEGAAA
jgi:predicted ATPase